MLINQKNTCLEQTPANNMRKLFCYITVVAYVIILCVFIVRFSNYLKYGDRIRNIYQSKRPVLYNLDVTEDENMTSLHDVGNARFPIQDVSTFSSTATRSNLTKSYGFGQSSKDKNRIINKPIQKAIRSTILTLFSNDFVPEIYNESVINGDTIHICLIAAKAETAGEIKIFARSVIIHARRSDVFFHFVVFKGSEKTIPPVLEEIGKSFVNVQYELVEVNLTKYLNDKLQNKVRLTHEWSGLYGVGKIFMYDLLPHVEKCIVIDTDTLFGTDPAFLWSEGQTRLRPPVAVATTWFPGDKFFNSGVTIHDFHYMRSIKFSEFITMKGCALRKENGTEKFLCYHDQLLMNMIMNDHQELFAQFTVSWNLGICVGFRNFTFDSFTDEKTGLFFGIAHLTCLPHWMKNVFQEGKGYLREKLQDYIDFLDGMDLRESGDKIISRVYN